MPRTMRPHCQTSTSGSGCRSDHGVMIMDTADRLMTMTELAAMLGVPVTTLYGWRSRGEGLPAYRIGRHIRYGREVIETWLKSRSDQPVHSAGEAWVSYQRSGVCPQAPVMRI